MSCALAEWPSDQTPSPLEVTDISSMQPKTSSARRRRRTKPPAMTVTATGTRRIASDSRKFENGVGFSSATALFGPAPAAAVGTQLLDCDHGRDRAERDVLLFEVDRRVDGRDQWTACERCRHALRGQQHRPEQAQRQHEAQRGARKGRPSSCRGSRSGGAAGSGICCAAAHSLRNRGRRQAAQGRNDHRGAHHRRDHLRADDADHLRQNDSCAWPE